MGDGVEGLATLVALIGLLTCVDVVVLDEGGALAEGAPALHTPVWSLTYVDPLVVAEKELLLNVFP